MTDAPPSATDRYRPSNRFSLANIVWALAGLLGFSAVIGATVTAVAAMFGAYALPLGLTLLAVFGAALAALGAALLERHEL